MGSYDPFRHLRHKLWPKERSGVKLVIWFLTIKSQESPRFSYMQVTCHILLERSRQGLQRFFKPHLNQRSAHKVMGPQSHGNPSLGIFGTPIWESRTKWHLDVGHVKRHKLYYKGEGGGFPQVQAVMSLISPSLPMVRPNTKNVQIMH
jgi:hypothetical protein